MTHHTDPTDHTQPPPEPGQQPDLSPADARAVDALFEAGLDSTRAGAGAERARVRRVASLLNLLDARVAPARESALVDVTLARILQTEGVGAADEAMTFDDEAAL